jgi:apolipoprotein N-acyltransferase
VLDALPTFVPGAMVTEVPLRTSITPAMLLGRGVDLWINILALVLLALALTKAQRDKRRSLKNSGEGTP